MTQQLTYDFTLDPVRNLDYFIPLQLTLDPEEKANFIANGYKLYKDTFSGSGRGLSSVEANDLIWKKTLAKCNEFFRPIGLKTRCATIFASDQNITAWGIHCDGVRHANGTLGLLEARISFYEVADAPGALRWWDSTLPTTIKELPADPTRKLASRVICFADCADDLRDDKITWDHIPSPIFSTTTKCASAIVRTNVPHHIIQGNGFRATIGLQIVFSNNESSGVWDHIQKNIHKLGV